MSQDRRPNSGAERRKAHLGRGHTTERSLGALRGKADVREAQKEEASTGWKCWAAVRLELNRPAVKACFEATVGGVLFGGELSIALTGLLLTTAI
jgi:hypothetical protein